LQLVVVCEKHRKQSPPVTKGRSAIVVGGGVIGVSSAYALARKGWAVRLLERSDEIATQTSWGNGRQLSYSHTNALASPGIISQIPGLLLGQNEAFRMSLCGHSGYLSWLLSFLGQASSNAYKRNTLAVLQLAQRSRLAMDALLNETAIDFGYQKPGKLVLFHSAKDLVATRPMLEAKRAAGLDQRTITPGEVFEREPALSHSPDTIAGALYSPDDASGNCHAFSQGLYDYSRQTLGVELRSGAHATQITRRANETLAELASGEVLAADLVVIANGHAANDLLSPLGHALPIQPMKGYSFTAPLGNASPLVSVTDAKRRIVFTHCGDRMLVAGIAEMGRVDTAVDKERLRTMIASAKASLPEAAVYSEADEGWAGLRPMTPNSQPIIGMLEPGIAVNAGHGMLGWTLAMGSAERLAEEVQANT